MMAYEIDKRLITLAVRDLPLNRRQQLSSYLNVEQILMSECGLARDYRGIAQQLNLSYSEIARLEKLCDPCGSLLNYQQVAELNVFDLFELLVSIGRFDILDDMIPVILDDMANRINREHNQSAQKLVPIQHESIIWYDAYVCYADSDLDFVRRLTEYLESPAVGFRLFVRDRDLMVGNWVYEAFARLIETQCRRMIIVLSPDFFQSHDCKFQSMFAAGLAIEKCQRILIPIIYKRCEEIPSILRLMSKIDMSGMANSIPDWSMKRLIMSIRPEQSPPQHRQIGPPNHHHQSIELNDNNNNDENPSNHQNVLMPFEKSETITIDSSMENNTQIKNNSIISVISNDENSSSTRPLIPNATVTASSSKTAMNSVDKNRSKNWIKTIKKKIKVAL